MNIKKVLSSEIYNEIPGIFDEFVDSTNEQLLVIENQLLVLEKDSKDDGVINDMMRGLHSIKGSSLNLELVDMGHLMHVAENIMSSVLSKTILFNDKLTDLILEAIDVAKLHLKDIQQAIKNNLQLQGVETHVALMNKLQSLSSL